MAKILVVEDDPSMREWLCEVLVEAGHQVTTACDGLEARSFAGRQCLDLLITDISMPNEEGLGLVRAVHKTHPQLKIIVMSGGDPEVLLDAKLLGAHAALRKPFTAKLAVQCVTDLAAAPPVDKPGSG